MRKAVAALLRRAGVDVRPAAASADARRRRILEVEGIDLVLDVGANEGQYARRLRRTGYRGRIVSLEPHAASFERLRAAAERDPAWECRRTALGERDGEARLGVGGSTETSSLLDVRAELEAIPEWRRTAVETVPLARLDAIADELLAGAERPYLKLDVQGYELAVLEGAAATLPRVRAVEAELTVALQYAGQPTYREVMDALAAAGLELAYLDPGYFHHPSGRLAYFDGIFVRAR